MESSSSDSSNQKAVYLSAQKVTIGAIVAFLFLIFGGIVVFAGQFGSAPEASPTPGPDGLFQAGTTGQFDAKAPQQQAKNAQNQANPTVKQPEKTPSPSPKSTPSPSASASPTTAPTPSPTPSPTSEATAAPTSNPLSVSCTSEPPSSVNVGSVMTWKATATGGNGSFSYSWSGDEEISGSDQNINKTYSSAGIKSASVKVSSNGTEVTATCQITVSSS